MSSSPPEHDAPGGKAGSPRVSVAIVSRERPAYLSRCLLAVSQLAYPELEVIVVADEAGAKAARDSPLAAHLKLARSPAGNVSAARNAAAALSAGDIVCFLDDDAVPEPTWLLRLAEPFADPGVHAAVGAVRGRNGISFQSLTPMIDRSGTTIEPGDRITDPDAAHPDGFVPKLVGTNMAIRRDTLAGLGGFDEAFRFYLEDAELGVRLAQTGHKIAFAPDAEVHHSVAPSSRRAASRMPRALFDVGRSHAIFLRKHAPDRDHPLDHRAARGDQHRRLCRHMIRGSCEPGEVTRLLGEFDAGWADGSRAEFGLSVTIPAAPAFTARPDRNPGRTCQLVTARPLTYRAARRRAKHLVESGHRVTVICLSPTALFHHVAFHPDGYWLQSGGQFGRSDRDQPLFQPSGSRARIETEWARVLNRRCPNFDTLQSSNW